ncbi:MAG: type I-C CRISPR-associated protein Cas8c/Csd1 [Gemmatimonadales bacterium]
MILQALYRLAQADQLLPDPDFEVKPVAWLVRVDRGGRLLGIESTHSITESSGKRKPKPVAQSRRIPRQPAGRAGTKAPPSFLVDNAKYVFGLATLDKPFSPAEGAEKSGWFLREVRKCAESTADEGAAAVLALLERVASRGEDVRLPDGCRSNELFAFVYAPDVDRCVHDRQAVVEYWRQLRQAGEAGEKDVGTRCLVTGSPMGAVPLFPLIKRVPGGQSAGAALVSFNKPAFESYGWDGNENAPISREAAEACATALSRLVHPAFPNPLPGRESETLLPRHVRLSEDTIVCFWSPEPASRPFLDCFAALFEASDPAQVGELYRAVWRGRAPQLDDPGEFYAMTLSGAQGRVIVRDWFETSVAKVAVNLARHFGDLAIVRNTPAPKGRELPSQLPLGALTAALAPLGARDAVPAPHAAGLVRAALRGSPYPLSLLQRAVERSRAEIGQTGWADFERRDARAALIKAVLNRQRRRSASPPSIPEVTVSMDPANRSPGYLLGRLLAVIERLQQVALNDVNASVVDRYFGAASATPRAVFTRLLRNARHHARKAKDDASAEKTARWLDNQIDEIASTFDPERNGFPAHLDLTQQGLFVIGYHHQRHWLWMSKDEREAWAAAAASGR